VVRLSGGGLQGRTLAQSRADRKSNRSSDHIAASTALAERPHASFSGDWVRMIAQHEFWNRRALRTDSKASGNRSRKSHEEKDNSPMDIPSIRDLLSDPLHIRFTHPTANLQALTLLHLMHRNQRHRPSRLLRHFNLTNRLHQSNR
jgi:hypothetical protein